MSKKTFKTEQETFWVGSFGTDYIKRNQGDALLASNLNFPQDDITWFLLEKK